MSPNLNKRVLLTITTLFILGFIALIVTAAFCKYDHDELEHLHSTWLVDQGQRPYTDFFQHHHPLLWYLSAWTGMVQTEDLQVLDRARLTMVIMAALILGLTYLLGREHLDTFSSWLAVAFLLSHDIFLKTVVEFRPDVPMVVLELLAALCLSKFLRQRTLWPLILAGLCCALAFLFLQKALFFVALTILILIIEGIRNRPAFIYLGTFCITFMAGLIPYFLYLTFTGQLGRYFFVNWTLNLHWLNRYPGFDVLGLSLALNPLFYLAALAGAFLILRSRDLRAKAYQYPLWALGLFAVPFVMPMRYSQYFLPGLPFFALFAGYACNQVLSRWAHKKLIWLLPLLFALPASFPYMIGRTILNPQTEQTARISYVLEQTDPADPVHDGGIGFNLFRSDLGYFWYSLNPGAALDTWRSLRPVAYDVYDLIKHKKPKVVNATALDITKPSLQEYAPSKRFPDLLIRLDENRPR